MKNIGIIFIGGNDGKCNVADLKRRAIYKPGLATAKTLANAQFHWSIFCAVFCRDQNGKEYMKSLLVQSGEKVRQRDLADQVNEIHHGMIKDLNKEHLVNIGWIACPDGRDLSEHDAGSIFDNAMAWDYLAKWESA